MSVEALTWALKQKVASAGHRCVLLILANYADLRTGACYPSQAHMGKISVQCERTVRTQLADMEADGLIRREGRRNSKGLFYSDIFHLNLPAELLHPDDPSEGRAKSSGKPCRRKTLPVASDGAGGRQHVAAGKDTKEDTKEDTKARAREAGAAPAAPASALAGGEAVSPANGVRQAAVAGPLTAEQWGRLESLLGKALVNSWFRGCSWDAKDRVLVAPTVFKRDWIGEQYGYKLAEVFDGKVRVEVAAAS